MKTSYLSMAILFAASLLYSCGGGSDKKAESTEGEASEVAEAVEATVPDSVALEISANDNMQFSTDELKVYEGQVVTLTLKHTGKMAKEAMGHNWVLLAKGADIANFGAAAVSAPDSDYIPQNMLESVLAYTSVIGGGEEVSITFSAPKAGYYKYICSFPGHWGVMQGSFTVQPR